MHTRTTFLAVIAGAALMSACAGNSDSTVYEPESQYVVERVKVGERGPRATLGGRMEFVGGAGGGAGDVGVAVSAPKDAGEADSKLAVAHELLTILGKLRTESNALKRAALIRKARRELPKFKETVIGLIFEGSTPYLEEVVDLAVVLRITDALPALNSLTDSENAKVAAIAIRGIDKLYAWPDDDLRSFLRDKRIPVLLAALEIVQHRSNRQLDLVSPLLGHPSSRVRALATRAVPSLQDGADIDRLCKLAKSKQQVTAKRAILAMGRTGVPSKAEACLMRFLGHRNDSFRICALQALANKTTQLTNATPVLKIALDKSKDLRTRAYALAALENTGTVPADELRWNMRSLPPTLRVLAARCLVRAGDRSALQDLVWLLDTDVSNIQHIENRMFVTHCAHQALTEISGKNMPASPRAWQQWLTRLGDRPLRPLRSPAALPF